MFMEKEDQLHTKCEEIKQLNLSKLEAKYEGYCRNPESHPLYTKEWEAYWKNNATPFTKYDEFVNKWISYWIDRMEQIHIEDKERISKCMDKNPTPIARKRNYEDEYEASVSYKKPPSPPSPDVEINNLKELLEFLVNLTRELGILEPKIRELLVKAADYEENEENSSNNLLDIEDNVILLETVREKFRGGLRAKLIDSRNVEYAKIAIVKIANLLHELRKRMNQIAEAKAEIAKVLTEELARKGIHDVTNADIEELIRGMVDESANYADNVENLTDDELIVLLQNFSHLTDEEQESVANFLSDLEITDPERAEMFKGVKNLKELLAM